MISLPSGQYEIDYDYAKQRFLTLQSLETEQDELVSHSDSPAMINFTLQLIMSRYLKETPGHFIHLISQACPINFKL